MLSERKGIGTPNPHSQMRALHTISLLASIAIPTRREDLAIRYSSEFGIILSSLRQVLLKMAICLFDPLITTILYTYANRKRLL